MKIGDLVFTDRWGAALVIGIAGDNVPVLLIDSAAVSDTPSSGELLHAIIASAENVIGPARISARLVAVRDIMLGAQPDRTVRDIYAGKSA